MLLLVLGPACSSPPEPRPLVEATPTEEPAPDPMPVVFIPGITGSQLMALDGHILWPPGGPGASRALSTEPVKEDFVRLSLNPATAPHDTLIATDVIRNDGPDPDDQIYSPLIYALTSEGYLKYKVNNDPRRRTTAGCDLTQKDKQPTLFVFAYDWRLSNVDNAAKLKDYVGCIRRFYPKTKVNIVTHSMGGLVARRFIIDNPDTVNKLVTVAAPFLGSPKPLYQMVWGLLGVSWTDNVAWVRYGTEVKEMLSYYPGLHELMSSRMYFALGGQPYLIEAATSLSASPVGYIEMMGPDGVVEKLFDKPSYNGKKPPESNRDFHSYSNNGNNQDDWSSDTTKVKYYHLIGVQQSSDTPLAVLEKHVLLPTPATEYTLEGEGPGDGTVPLLSAQRMGADGRSLNAPNAKVWLFTSSSGGDELLEHTGIMRNPETLKLILRILAEDDVEPPTPTPTPKATGTPTPTRTPTPAPTPTPGPTATAVAAPTWTFDSRNFRYVLKRVEVSCGSSAPRTVAPSCTDIGAANYQELPQKPSLEVGPGKATWVRVGKAKPDGREPDTTRTIAWPAAPQELVLGQTYRVALKGSLTRTTEGTGPLLGKMPYGAMNAWVRATWTGVAGPLPLEVQPPGYSRVGNDADSPTIQDTEYTIRLDPVLFRQELETKGLRDYARRQLTVMVNVAGYTGDSGVNAKTGFGAPFIGSVYYTYGLAFQGPPP